MGAWAPRTTAIAVRRVLATASAFATAATVVTAAGGCAQPDRHATPETVLRAFVAAARQGDVGAMRAVAVAPERLRRALACPPDDAKIDVIEAVADAHATMHERAGLRIALLSVAEESPRTVAIGDDYRGCRATESFELRRLRALVRDEDAGSGAPREKHEAADVVRLDRRWWLVVPSR